MVKTERKLEVSVVAQKLNVSAQTVRNYLRDPDHPLRGTKVGPRKILVYSSSVDKALEEGEEKLCY